MRTSAALLLAAALTAAGDKSPRWARSWDEAVKEARFLNQPIVVHRHGFY